MICQACRQHIAMLETAEITAEGVRHVYRCKSCQSDWRVDNPDAVAQVEPIEPGLMFASLLVDHYDGLLTPVMASEAMTRSRTYVRATRDAHPAVRRLPLLRGELPRT